MQSKPQRRRKYWGFTGAEFTALVVMAVIICVALAGATGVMLYINRTPALVATSTPVQMVVNPTSTPFVFPPTYTPTPSDTPQPTNTPRPVSPPTATPQPTALILPTLTPVPRFKGTEAEFKAYLRRKYSAIAGKALEIQNIFILNEGGSLPIRSVTIDLTEDSGFDIFGEQTKADATTYGRNLLRDAVAYFGGQDCYANLEASFYTMTLDDLYFDKEWWYVGSWQSGHGWRVSKHFVKAHFTDGFEGLEVWNYK
jgi:hypothetical protein